jgi:hypothetical protein
MTFTSPVWPDMLATAGDYEQTPGVPDAPANIDAILIACTGLVQDATVTAIFAVDTDGNATDPVIAKALTAATVAQAAAWVKLGIDPAAGGVVEAGAKSSKRLATAAITYADAADAAAARTAAHDSLVPAAVRILTRANLLAGQPWVL